MKANIPIKILDCCGYFVVVRVLIIILFVVSRSVPIMLSIVLDTRSYQLLTIN